MRGTHNDLVITTSFDEATETEVPLLHFPVQICKATGSVDVKYDNAAPSGAEYETRYFDTATGEFFDYADRQQGVRGPDGFTPIATEQIEAIDESTKLVDMRVEKAVPYEDVPFERATGLYYLQVPAKSGAHKVYNLIYHALLTQKKGKKEDKQRLALRVKFTSRSRQKVGFVYADAEKGCLVMNTVAFAAEVREPDEAVLAHQAAQIEQEQIEKARKVVIGLLNVEADEPTDDAIERKRELVEQAAAGQAIEVAPIPKAKTVEADKVSDLLDASLANV